MIILGINGGFGGGYQDSCAALIRDGVIIGAIEEERLSGIKFSPGVIPERAIARLLSSNQLSIHDIDEVAVHGASWTGSFKAHLRSFFYHHFGHSPEISQYFHHDCHAASTFFCSGFDDAIVFTMDNSGDGISTQIMIGSKEKGVQRIVQFKRPQSFGTFYSAVTQLCGFRRDADEYKLMGLSSFGRKAACEFPEILKYEGNGVYTLDEKYLLPIADGIPFPHKQIPLYSDLLWQEVFGKSNPTEVFGNRMLLAEVAAAAQEQLESIASQFVKYWVQKTGIKNVCLAGGVALNCALNQKIAEMPEVEALYIPPFVGDQGVAIGAALLASFEKESRPQLLRSPYLGSAYGDMEILEALNGSKVKYQKIDAPEDIAAELILEGKVIGWFQGRSEIGPRALGNRSILASPFIPGMKDKINKTIKFRESFRPFCPSILSEDLDKLFERKESADYSYMNINVSTKQQFRHLIDEVVHVDGTARVQDVKEEQNPVFYRLLKNIQKKTGYGVVINTSFNVRSHPMVNDPWQALECFFSSGMDALFIGRYLIEKPQH
jgi:carbamoyltransferase